MCACTHSQQPAKKGRGILSSFDRESNGDFSEDHEKKSVEELLRPPPSHVDWHVSRERLKSLQNRRLLPLTVAAVGANPVSDSLA